MDLLPMVPGSCSLDQDGLKMQLSRWRVAGHGAQLIEKSSQGLVIRVDPQASTVAIEELVTVERACCPFFDLRWDPEARDLKIAVAQPEHEPALAAIAYALGLSDSGPGDEDFPGGGESDASVGRYRFAL